MCPFVPGCVRPRAVYGQRDKTARVSKFIYPWAQIGLQSFTLKCNLLFWLNIEKVFKYETCSSFWLMFKRTSCLFFKTAGDNVSQLTLKWNSRMSSNGCLGCERHEWHLDSCSGVAEFIVLTKASLSTLCSRLHKMY